MISLDTNILLPALETGNGNHKRAAAFIETIAERRDVAVPGAGGAVPPGGGGGFTRPGGN